MTTTTTTPPTMTSWAYRGLSYLNARVGLVNLEVWPAASPGEPYRWAAIPRDNRAALAGTAATEDQAKAAAEAAAATL